MKNSNSPDGQQLVNVNRFGLRIAARLSAGVDDGLPHDISERLRAARVQAVDRRKWVLSKTATEIYANGHAASIAAGHDDAHSNWWNRLGAICLLLTLALGLFTINAVQDEIDARELADIDAAILTDDLPPAAYVDSGFAQFLKSGQRWDQ